MKNARQLSLLLLVIIFTAGCKKEKTEEQGGPPTPVTQVDIAKVDQQVEAFISRFSVPGASLAVSKNGKLVYRKGYGLADKESGEKVTADHRFRLASVSKTYTAAAILKLVEAGKLSLTDKVFGAGALLGTTYGTQPYSANLANITVSHLLHNTSGGWGAGSGGDPIDINPQLSNDDFLNWVIDNKPVKYAPGTRYDYSNTGFFIAGRIIEKLSGKPYVSYIKEMVSAVNDKNTDVAGPALSDRKTKEVKYYGQGTDGQWTYTMALKRRDADGGLMTTATDLLRFINAIDGSTTRLDILKPSSLAAMTTGSGAAPLSNSYGLGIGLWDDLWYNYGSLPGTRTGFMRSSNGTCVALLLNSRQQNDTFVYAMQDLLLVLINDNSITWQNIDQF